MGADAGLDEFDEAVDRLGSLIAKSLVEHSDAATVSRYRLLETIRVARRRTTRHRREHHASAGTCTPPTTSPPGRELFAMLTPARDFEALEQLRIDTPNLTAGLRWLLGSDHVQGVLVFFYDADLDDLGIMPFVLLDELGRVADEALRRPGSGAAKGYIAAVGFSGNRAFAVGDWNRQAEVVRGGRAC